MRSHGTADLGSTKLAESRDQPDLPDPVLARPVARGRRLKLAAHRGGDDDRKITSYDVIWSIVGVMLEPISKLRVVADGL